MAVFLEIALCVAITFLDQSVDVIVSLTHECTEC